MTKITEVAKSFEQHAKTQNAAIEKAVIKEFEKLRGVIERESESAQTTYENAIQNLNRKHWTHSTLRALPLTVLVIFATLTTSAAWGWYVFYSGKHLATLANSQDGAPWVQCKETFQQEDSSANPKAKTAPKENKNPIFCRLE